MATVFGTNATLVYCGNPTAKAPAGEAGGALRTLADTYAAAATAIGTVIVMGGAVLPTGTRIKDVVLGFDALGAGVTLSVGDVGNPARYINAQSASAAGVARLSVNTGLDYQQTADTQLLVTIGGGAATGNITIAACYA